MPPGIPHLRPPAQERPPIQRPPIQRPLIQRPPIQRPPIQRPPIQRPPIQRPPMQRTVNIMQNQALQKSIENLISNQRIAAERPNLRMVNNHRIHPPNAAMRPLRSLTNNAGPSFQPRLGLNVPQVRQNIPQPRPNLGQPGYLMTPPRTRLGMNQTNARPARAPQAAPPRQGAVNHIEHVNSMQRMLAMASKLAATSNVRPGTRSPAAGPPPNIMNTQPTNGYRS